MESERYARRLKRAKCKVEGSSCLSKSSSSALCSLKRRGNVAASSMLQAFSRKPSGPLDEPSRTPRVAVIDGVAHRRIERQPVGECFWLAIDIRVCGWDEFAPLEVTKQCRQALNKRIHHSPQSGTIDFSAFVHRDMHPPKIGEVTAPNISEV